MLYNQDLSSFVAQNNNNKGRKKVTIVCVLNGIASNYLTFHSSERGLNKCAFCLCPCASAIELNECLFIFCQTN